MHVFTIILYNAFVLKSQLLVHWYKMMSHLLIRHKSLVRSRNRRLCWQRPSKNTCFAGEIDLLMKWPCLLHDSSERCVSMIIFFSALAYFTRLYYSRTFYNHVRRFLNFIVIIMRAVHVTITFCSSRGCLWKCVTVKTRFCRPKRLFLSSLTLAAILNVPCTLLDQISTQFSPVYCYQIQLWQIIASGTSGLQVQNIVVQLSGYGD